MRHLLKSISEQCLNYSLEYLRINIFYLCLRVAGVAGVARIANVYLWDRQMSAILLAFFSHQKI